jgi:hypothetical protein
MGLEVNKIHKGLTEDLIKQMDNKSINLIVTIPVLFATARCFSFGQYASMPNMQDTHSMITIYNLSYHIISYQI